MSGHTIGSILFGWVGLYMVWILIRDTFVEEKKKEKKD